MKIIKEKIFFIIAIIIAIIIVFAIGYRVAEMKYEDTSIFTYYPESIND